jgi:hypothetical protein
MHARKLLVYGRQYIYEKQKGKDQVDNIIRLNAIYY